MKGVINTLAIDIKCRKCNACHENVEDPEEILHEDVEKVTDLSCLGGRIYSCCGCEAAATSRTRLG